MPRLKYKWWALTTCQSSERCIRQTLSFNESSTLRTIHWLAWTKSLGRIPNATISFQFLTFSLNSCDFVKVLLIRPPGSARDIEFDNVFRIRSPGSVCMNVVNVLKICPTGSPRAVDFVNIFTFGPQDSPVILISLMFC